MLKMSDLVCDPISAEWARDLGRRDRSAYSRGSGARGERICPFSEGTQHRLYWFEGWRGVA